MNEEKKEVVQPTTAETSQPEEKVQETANAPAPVAEGPKEEKVAEENKEAAPVESAPKEEVKEEKKEEPAPEVKEEAPAPVPQEPAAETQTAPVEQPAAPAPVEGPKVEVPAAEAPTAPAAPVEAQPAPVQEAPAAPALPVEPAPAPAPAPVQAEAQPAPAPAAPAAPVAPKAEETVVPAVAPAQAAPTPPQGETITEAPALNPIANEPAQAVQPAPAQPATNAATVAPSNPLNTQMDTNIGFVAVGEEMKKKKNVPLILTIVLVLLVGLGALGYFVIYPMVVNKLTKPKDVYYAVIDKAFKEVAPTVEVIAHNKAIFDIEAQIDTNIEQLKDLNGYTYAFNGGFDPVNKKLQGGIKIIDTASQEHSAYIYVKENRQYLRLSSYRELIYYNPNQDLNQYWDQIYSMTENINSEEYNKIVNKYIELLKNGIVESKLSKEEASITINGNSYKVLNSKYAIDNETVTAMAKTIRDGFASDDEILDIIAKNTKIDKEKIKQSLEAYDFSKPMLPEGTVYYLNVYTYSVKNTLVGIELTQENNSIHYYTMDDYFEIKADATNHNEQTGKDETTNLFIEGKKVNGKTNVTFTYNNKQYAKMIINAWDEKTKDFTYEINYGEQVVSGSIKLIVDNNESRSKVNLNVAVNVDNQYFKLALAITNDWTSEVANINAGTAKELSDAEIENKLKEFISELKGTPLYKMIATESGDIDPSTFQYRFGGSKAIDNCSPGTNCTSIDEPVENNNNSNINEQPGNEA